MMIEERCPYCKSESYEVNDFNNDYCNEDEINFSWQYKCNECNRIFYIIKWYKLVGTAIKTQEEYEGE